MYPPQRIPDSTSAPRTPVDAASAVALLRRRWLPLLLAYAGSILLGIAYAWLVQRGGDWDIGLPWERELLLRVRDTDVGTAMEWVLLAVPWLGTNLTLFPVALLASAWLAWRTRWDLAAWLMTAELGCLSMNWFIKQVSARERPELWDRVGWFGWGSYPSGHAMASVAMLGTFAAILLQERGWRWPWVATVVLTALIVYSRLHHGVHWPTDMVGGLLVGALWLVATSRALSRRQPSPLD